MDEKPVLRNRHKAKRGHRYRAFCVCDGVLLGDGERCFNCGWRAPKRRDKVGAG